VCGRFQQSLASLVQILSCSSRHYVRCIKPNDKLQPGIFTSVKVIMQLRSNGIFETIRMRKAGYASHIPFDIFYKRFSFLGFNNSSKEVILSFLSHNFPDKTQWVIGKSKVFLKEKMIEYFDNLRREYFGKSVIKIQSRIRTYHWMIKLQILIEHRQKLIRSSLIMQRYIRSWTAKQRLAVLIEQHNRRLRAIIIFQR